MHASQDVFSQRRPSKYSDPVSLAISSKDMPSDIATMRMQQSFKGSQGSLLPLRMTFHRGLPYTILGCLLTAALLWGLLFGSEAFLFRANSMGRDCLNMHVVRQQSANRQNKETFAMVTSSDDGARIPGRSFDGLMSMVAPNKVKYAQRHGYTFINASDTLDNSRPASWSKILAVRKHLSKFDWVFWNDADSLVTNSEISLDDIIESVMSGRKHTTVPDLILTKDVTGINAGMFFFRNSKWSLHFLELWWNQTSFIRPIGQMKSGDNDALKYLLQTMPEDEFHEHVAVPQMQCAFNSYVWRPTLKSALRLIKLPKVVWQGSYSTGDFMVHFAGLNNKKAWVQRFLAMHEAKDLVIQKRSGRRGGPPGRDSM